MAIVHNLEFVKYDGHYMLDLMRDNTTLLGFELDIHWIWRAGLDPIAVGSSPALHIQ